MQRRPRAVVAWAPWQPVSTARSKLGQYITRDIMRGMRRVVFDTDVVVAALRSPGGAAAELLRRVYAGRLDMLASVTLFAEYEAVLLRPEHLLASGQSADAMNRALDELAERVVRVHCRFQPRFGSWARPSGLSTAAMARREPQPWPVPWRGFATPPAWSRAARSGVQRRHPPGEAGRGSNLPIRQVLARGRKRSTAESRFNGGRSCATRPTRWCWKQQSMDMPKP